MAKALKKVPRHYWDACVFASYIDGLPDRAPIIHDLLQACSNGDVLIFTSHLSIAEVAFAETEKNKGALNADQEARIDALWMPPSKIKMVEVSEIIAYEARLLMRQGLPEGWALKPNDAIHLASAKHSQATRVCTYDKPLRKYKDRIGMEIDIPPLAESLFGPMGSPE